MFGEFGLNRTLDKSAYGLTSLEGGTPNAFVRLFW
jgi:hypothetical protein